MNIKKLLTWVGVIGSIASLASLVYIFLPQEKRIKLFVLTTSQENLTQTQSNFEPELKISYQYKGIQITDLWKYNIKFINNSKKTLIGIGTQKNVLQDYLTFKIKNGLEILDYKNVVSEFNHKLTLDSTNLRLTFEQWRPNEVLEYTFYIKDSSHIKAALPFEQIGFRQIIDGDIVFEVEQKEKEQRRITQHIPQQGLIVLYIVSLILILALIVGSTILLVLNMSYYYRRSVWYKTHYLKFKEFIKAQYLHEEESQMKYISNPDILPTDVWKNFKGDGLPSGPFNITKFYELLIAETIFLLTSISLVIVFIDLIYYFP